MIPRREGAFRREVTCSRQAASYNGPKIEVEAGVNRRACHPVADKTARLYRLSEVGLAEGAELGSNILRTRSPHTPVREPPVCPGEPEPKSQLGELLVIIKKFGGAAPFIEARHGTPAGEAERARVFDPLATIFAGQPFGRGLNWKLAQNWREKIARNRA